MARKRMFDLAIINQDEFLDLPMESKAIYFLLGMEADDEGFVSPKKVLRLYGGTEDSLKVLIAKRFIIPFESGVIVITDWKRNNYLDKKRVKETIYQEEKSKLYYNENTEKYEILEDVKHPLNKSLTNVKQTLKENRIEENRIEENSIEKENIIKEKERKVKKSYGKYNRIKLTDEEYRRLVNDFGSRVIEKQIELLDEYVESNNNKNKYSNFNLVIRKSLRENWFRNKIEPDWFNKQNDIEKTSIEDIEEIDKILGEMSSG